MIQKIESRKHLKKFEQGIALSCISLPFLLWWADGFAAFRPSISDYVLMDRSYIFGMLLTIVAMQFIINGILYMNIEDIDGEYTNQKNGRWYNIILGMGIFIVILFPLDEYVFVHKVGAAIFFAGSALAIAIFRKHEHRKISIVIGVAALIPLLLSIFFGRITLFWAEWISLIIIGIHYFLESKGDLSLR